VSSSSLPKGGHTKAIDTPSVVTGGVSRLAPWALVVLCVLIPFGVMVNVALHSITTFDGGLNFQVAYNIAHGAGYSRDYGGRIYSPIEVETSGFFLIAASIGFKLFGLNNVSLAFPNLLFMILLLAGASFALRRRPVLRLLAPFVLILFTPRVAEFGLDGFGEFVSASLSLWCFILITEVIEGTRKPYLIASLAWLVMGIGLTIKVVSVATLPVALAGFTFALLLHPELRRPRFGLTSLWMFLPVAIWEIYRYIEVNSADRWAAYWRTQLSGISDRAATGDAHEGILHKGLDHLHLLRAATGLDAVPLVLILLAPLVGLLAALVSARRLLPQWLGESGHSLAVQLGAFVALYEIWWIFLTPTPQAWLRRFEIGWISLVLLTLLLFGMLWDEVRDRRGTAYTVRRWRFVAPTAIAALIVVTVCLPGAWSLAKNNLESYKASDAEQTEEAGASTEAARLAASGATLCGSGWWAAPVVSLTAKVPFCNLLTLPTQIACSPPMRQSFDSGRVYLVWDRYAAGLVSPTPPRSARFIFTRAPSPTPYASFWTTSLQPSTCR
jgi:hypothetical protein